MIGVLSHACSRNEKFLEKKIISSFESSNALAAERLLGRNGQGFDVKVDFDNTGYDCYLKYVLILNEKFLKKVYVLHEPC